MVSRCAVMVLFAGCSTEPPPLDVKVASMDATGVILEVTTAPGATLTAGRASAVADAQGHATITLPYESIPDPTYTSINVYAESGRAHAYADVTLPMSPKEAMSRPADGTPWFRLKSVPGLGTAFSLLYEDRETWAGEFGKPLPITIDSGKGNVVTIDGKAVVFDESGYGRTEVDVNIWAFPAVTSREHVFSVPVHVESPAGGSKDAVIDLSTNGLKASVIALFSPVATGQVVNPTPDAGGAKGVGVILKIDDSPDLKFYDADTLGDVDVVAIATRRNTREGKVCGGYTSTDGGSGDFKVTIWLDDADVEAFDARTGKSLGKKEFQATLTRDCPMFATTGESFTEKPSPDAIGAWAGTL